MNVFDARCSAVVVIYCYVYIKLHLRQLRALATVVSGGVVPQAFVDGATARVQAHLLHAELFV